LEPNVIVVDDEPDEQRGLIQELKGCAQAKVLHPREVKEEHLREAHLALIDYRITDWAERDAIPYLCLKVSNGLALAEILRSHSDTIKRSAPIAFAIYTAHLSDLSGNLPPDSRPHTVARRHNLEWAFSKSSYGSAILSQQILSLASAVASLPTAWTPDNIDRNKELTNDLLGLNPDVAWLGMAWDEIDKCHPPLHELSEWTHGIAFLRWLLQQILPYPCFLWDLHYLAARFRVTYESVKQAMETDEQFRQRLEPYAYRGILSCFLGPRWWRAGIETLLWENLQSDSFDLDKLVSFASSLTKNRLVPLGFPEPAVCLDERQQALDVFCPIEEAVRIEPDDWPLFADRAWASIDLARSSPYVKSLVVERDRGRL
jgi:hypothetical protein